MKRPMFVIGFVYILALLILQGNVPEKNLIFAPIISALICILLIFIPITRKNKTIIISAVTITFAAIVSFVNFKINIETTRKYSEREEIISGIIDDLPYEKNGTLHYKVKVDYVTNEEVTPFKVMLSSSAPLECDFGDRLYCVAHFYIPQSSYFFDSKQYYHSQGIYINAYVKNPDQTYVKKNPENSLRHQIIKLRTKLLDAPKNFLDEKIVNIQNGIFLGEQNNIENLQKINLLKNGIYHLVCTSGIHISVIVTIFLWCFKKLKFEKKLSCLLAIIPIFLFILLTGFSLSAVRVGIMYTICLLAAALSKKSDSLNSIGLSIFLICLLNPNSALSLGLWMSALSVLGITLFNQKIFLFFVGRFNKKIPNNPMVKAIISSVSVSLSASILTAPLTIFYSKIFSLTQIFTNIIFVPLTTVILISALILSVICAVGLPRLIIYPFAFICGINVKFFIKLSDFFAKIPFCYISLDYPFIKFWIGIIILTAAVCFVLFNRTKAFAFSIIIPVTALICGVFSYQIYSFNRTHISVINGNESVMCIIRKNGHTACISCFGEKNYIKNFENFLECSNINDIDYFAVADSKNLPDKFIKNTIKNHKINCFILPSYDDKYISSEETGIYPLYFGTELHSSIWGGELSVDSVVKNDCSYTNIKIYKFNILIVPEGGNIDDIPDNMNNFDIILSYGIPVNFEYKNYESVIMYGPQYVISEYVSKFGKYVKIYNLAYYGKLNITLKNNNNNYKIGV